jgi:hypothetical protein
MARFGYLEMVFTDMLVPEDDKRLNHNGGEFEKVLYAIGREAVEKPQASSTVRPPP